jgi:hypothetical protein
MSKFTRQAQRHLARNQHKVSAAQAAALAASAHGRINWIIHQLKLRGVNLEEDVRTPGGVVLPRDGIGSTEMIGTRKG